MNYHHQNQEVPERTAEVARKAFKKGNIYLKMRDEMGVIFANEQFGHLFSHAGRRAEAPGNLALILVMQYLEGLSDRGAAEQVGARIDWKYLLGLELDEEGLNHQTISKFRERLVAGGEEELLLGELLSRFEEKGWLKSKKKQRTDSTYVISAVRRLNRVELVWETLSLVLEELAWEAPRWLEKQIDGRWVKFYARPMGWRSWSNDKKEQEVTGNQIGKDGYYLWHCMQKSPFFKEWQTWPVVQVWLQVWRQQYYIEEEEITWRQGSELPPAAVSIENPHDIEARYSEQQRGVGHVGYQVHYTETVTSRKEPQLITDVTTTPAAIPDSKMTLTIQQKLVEKGLAPETHLVDCGYVSAPNLVQSQKRHRIDLYGPTRSDTSWQKRQNKGYDSSHFHINWQEQQVTCPQNQVSTSWRNVQQDGHPHILVRFSAKSCKPCVARVVCTRSPSRAMSIQPQLEQEALVAARERQRSSEFKRAYCVRSGVEALISQSVHGYDSRRSRYVGLAKTHLHNVLTATAINFGRVATWLLGRTRARTRYSPLLAMQFT